MNHPKQKCLCLLLISSIDLGGDLTAIILCLLCPAAALVEQEANING